MTEYGEVGALRPIAERHLTGGASGTVLTALEFELRNAGASPAARHIVLEGGPIWQGFLFVQLVEDRISAVKAADHDVEAPHLTRSEVMGWVTERVGSVLELMEFGPATEAVREAIGSITIGEMPRTVGPILLAAEEWATRYERAYRWRAEVRATNVPPAWSKVRDIVSTGLDPFLEAMEQLLARVKASVVVGRAAALRNEQPPPSRIEVAPDMSPAFSVLPEAIRQAVQESYKL
jgi:hypothetical protein